MSDTWIFDGLTILEENYNVRNSTYRQIQMFFKKEFEKTVALKKIKFYYEKRYDKKRVIQEVDNRHLC